MMYIDLSKISAVDPDVSSWKNKAGILSKKLKKYKKASSRKNFLVRNNLWSEFKPILLRYYGKKCWYSECLLTGSFGDVDHFRPKNKSRDENGVEILADGYWWLAYDYRNYRLSCEKCNRSFDCGGKNDAFPIKEGTTPASNPNCNDINLLLDPCNKNDCLLIDCDDLGAIKAQTSNTYEKKRVEISVHIYNLDINEFKEDRIAIRDECKSVLERFVIHYAKDDKAEIQYDLESVLRLVNPKRAFSSFAKKYIYEKIKDEPYEPVLKSVLDAI